MPTNERRGVKCGLWIYYILERKTNGTRANCEQDGVKDDKQERD